MSTAIQPKLVNTATAAEIIGSTKGTLQTWRSQGVPHQPPYVRIGKSVRYRISDLEEWVRTRGREG